MSYSLSTTSSYWVGYGAPSTLGKGGTVHAIACLFRVWAVGSTNEAELCSLLCYDADTVLGSGNGEALSIDTSGNVIARIAVNGTQTTITGPTVTTGKEYFAALTRDSGGTYSLYVGAYDSSGRITAAAGTASVVDVSARPSSLNYIATQTWGASGFSIEVEHLQIWNGDLSLQALNSLRVAPDSDPREFTQFAEFPFRRVVYADLSATPPDTHGNYLIGNVSYGYPIQQTAARAAHKRLTLPRYDGYGGFVAYAGSVSSATAAFAQSASFSSVAANVSSAGPESIAAGAAISSAAANTSQATANVVSDSLVYAINAGGFPYSCHNISGCPPAAIMQSLAIGAIPRRRPWPPRYRY